MTEKLNDKVFPLNLFSRTSWSFNRHQADKNLYLRTENVFYKALLRKCLLINGILHGSRGNIYI